MEVLLGFSIAVLIGLTGVGGGVITAPVLTLFLGVPAAESVGTALLFTVVVKLAAAPVYLLRRQVNFRILGRLLAGGLPGVIAGSYFLAKMSASARRGPLYLLLGGMIIVLSAANLARLFFQEPRKPGREHERWLPWVALPIGAEVGFSSAGAGALGSVALMSLTAIPTGQVVGTDVLFGLGLSLAGGGISLANGNYQGLLAIQLAAGGLAGALVGANLAALAPSRPLRIALSLWLVALGCQLCWRAAGQ